MSARKEKSPFVIDLQSNYGTTASGQALAGREGTGAGAGVGGASPSPSTLYCLHGKPQVKIVGHCHRQRSEGVDVSARRKLIIASVLCLIFMVVEIVGGVWSNSLAIATDAAHLLTDFASFMISLFAIWLAGRPSTKRMSFGWYRAEVIGAVISVVMIWIITGILLYLAVLRIIYKTYEVDAVIMLITSGFAIAVNLVMGCQLHHHGHTHSHKSPTTTVSPLPASVNTSRRPSRKNSLASQQKIAHLSVNSVPLTPTSARSHNIIEKETGHINLGDPSQHRIYRSTSDEVGSLVNIISSSDQDGVISVVGQPGNQDQNENLDPYRSNPSTNSNAGGEDTPTTVATSRRRSEYDHSHETAGAATTDHSHSHSHSGSFAAPGENINVRAAFIHVLGDVLQSVGVFIAALVIYFRPDWAIADPICTFVFSVIVLFTTFNIMKDALLVLMEGTPGYLHYAEVMHVFLQIPGVERVHNLRIWALSINKIALSAHLAVKTGVDPKKILQQATSAVHLKYNFFETTIQIEDFIPEMEDCRQCLEPGN